MLSEIRRVLRESPGIKGRAIAKKIGADRKEVNLFLSNHRDEFTQDSNYEWSLIEPEKITVEFEDNKWVDRNSFEKSLSMAGSPLDLDCLYVTFVVPEGCRILLDAAARLLALCNQLSETKKVIIDFDGCKDTLHYFDRIGFLDHLNRNVTIIPKRPRMYVVRPYGTF